MKKAYYELLTAKDRKLIITNEKHIDDYLSGLDNISFLSTYSYVMQYNVNCPCCSSQLKLTPWKNDILTVEHDDGTYHGSWGYLWGMWNINRNYSSLIGKLINYIRDEDPDEFIDNVGFELKGDDGNPIFMKLSVDDFMKFIRVNGLIMESFTIVQGERSEFYFSVRHYDVCNLD